MNTNARSTWPKIPATLAALAVLYVLSFRPACWLVGRDVLPVSPTAIVYDPILRLAWSGPRPISAVVYRLGTIDGDRVAFWSMCAVRGIIRTTAIE